MFAQLLSIFLDVVLPVFGIVAGGYVLGPKLQLDSQTLSRVAYYAFVPAFTFHVISNSQVALGSALRMAGCISLVHVLIAAMAWVVARVFRRSREIAAAFVMIAVFGNVGNFGLALIKFRLGPTALAPATIYFITIVITAFFVCVGVAGWLRGGGLSALVSIFRTPALLVVPPALYVSTTGVEVPPVISRMVGLLADAMIPTMLLALGLQLAATRSLRVSFDVVLATGVRLVMAPAIAAAVIVPFGITGLDRATAILQSGMPAAVLVSIIAMEYEVAPTFVTTAVFFSTLCSLPTLTFLLSLF